MHLVLRKMIEQPVRISSRRGLKQQGFFRTWQCSNLILLSSHNSKFPLNFNDLSIIPCGWIKVFRTINPKGNTEYWATSQLDMSLEQAAAGTLGVWQIEVYHRSLKQFTGIECSQFRLEVAQRNHIGLAIRAFVRLEVQRLRQHISYFEAKTAIIHDAIRAYLAHATLIFGSTV